MALRILFVGDLDANSNSLAHFRALQACGCEVEGLDPLPYLARGGRFAAALRQRSFLGPAVAGRNRDILARAQAFRPHLLWGEKPVAIRPATLARLRAQGVLLVSHNIDNPFGTMNEPVWRLFRRAIAAYDLHLVPRSSSMVDYPPHGARAVLMMENAYDPDRHFPPPAGWSDGERDLDLSFTGSPYDDRARHAVRLWREHGIATDIMGNRWDRHLPADAMAALVRGVAVYNDAYRSRIWRSKLCLAFVTHANHDETAIRSFEITACQGLLLSERTERLQQCFEEDVEAVYFASVEECAAKVQRYLADAPARERIAAAGRARALASGYSYQARTAKVLDEIRELYSNLPD